MNQKIFVTDCEGPLSVNDNAYEICQEFIPNGSELFTILSNYDDVLVEKSGDENYRAGSTLKLILPFLYAYNVMNDDIIEYSQDNIYLLHGALDTLNYITNIMPAYIVSTSYNQYIEALCNVTGFNYENTYSTRLDLDKYNIDIGELEKIKQYKEEILNDSSFENIHKIFIEKFPLLESNKMILDVVPIGGLGKKESIIDIVNKNNYQPENIMYLGDSITDTDVLDYIKNHNGLSISFNGNEHAINTADIAVITDNTVITSLISEIFNNNDLKTVYDFISKFNENPFDAINQYSNNNKLIQELLINKLPIIKKITSDNKDDLIIRSKNIRNQVRGENIGLLG
ncbi:MAG: hypothetical protein Q4Q23_07405 [Methanobacteriaceae archaeon]|nr:hypothetical protein [Methanobacteriaceae archaeon]